MTINKKVFSQTENINVFLESPHKGSSPHSRRREKSSPRESGKSAHRREGSDSGSDRLTSKPPSVKPPTSNKSTLYKSPKVFSDTDKRAVQVQNHM